MKILVISAEVWRNDKNGGNVLSNIFGDTGYEFAQIYCNPGQPVNNLCKQYFQITDSMLFQNILHKCDVGKKIVFEEFPKDNEPGNSVAVLENKKIYSFFRNHRLEIFYVMRSCMWKIAKWKTPELKRFILDFNPDIIFAPCYGAHEMLAMTRYVKRVAQKPIISYISDDHYGLMQFRLSPIYWINRLMLRYNMRKTFPLYDLVYTMTEEQMWEYEKKLKCSMKILKKYGEFSEQNIKCNLNKPLRLIYAGGIYCGRWKTLAKIVECLRKINHEGVKIVLDIYTGNELTEKQMLLLNDGKNSKVHKSVSAEELKKRYRQSDIALHVESFELKYKLLTRLSFSTKIIDCLESGCAVLAICWKHHSGYTYLKKEDAALCVDSVSGIEKMLIKIINNPTLILEYSKKAFLCGQRNHQRKIIQKHLQEDFENISKCR